MLHITFHNSAEIADGQLKFAVIAAKYRGQWIICRHKERTTWEIPGGHREPGETISETARRELQEETGAAEFGLKPVCVYGVDRNGAVSYGMLFFAEVQVLGVLPPEMEIGEIRLCSLLPKELTYPEIQPHLFHYIQGWLNLQSRGRRTPASPPRAPWAENR